MLEFCKINQKNMEPENSVNKSSHHDKNFKHVDILDILDPKFLKPKYIVSM